MSTDDKIISTENVNTVSAVNVVLTFCVDVILSSVDIFQCPVDVVLTFCVDVILSSVDIFQCPDQVWSLYNI